MDTTTTNSSPDIEVLFAKVNDKVITSSSLRQLAIEKIQKALSQLDIDPNDSKGSKLLEAQMGMISTYDSLLKSEVTDIMNQTKLTISKKSNDTLDEMSKQAILMLKELRGIEIVKTEESFQSNVSDADDFLDNIDSSDITPDELKLGISK